MDLDVQWRPGIGDPTFIGWFTVAAYLFAAILCGAVARAIRARVPAAERGRQVAVWWVVTGLLVALAVNKQLDLQSLLTDIGREIAGRQGWIERRREVQTEFVAALAAAAILALGVGVWSIRRRWRDYGPLFLGVTLTVAFVVVRAAEFNHIGSEPGDDAAAPRTEWALELAAIAVVASAATVRLRRERRRSAPPP